jgi:hypothetical protein
MYRFECNLNFENSKMKMKLRIANICRHLDFPSRFQQTAVQVGEKYTTLRQSTLSFNIFMYTVSREIMYAPTLSTPIQVFVFLFILSGIL